MGYQRGLMTKKGQQQVQKREDAGKEEPCCCCSHLEDVLEGVGGLGQRLEGPACTLDAVFELGSVVGVGDGVVEGPA